MAGPENHAHQNCNGVPADDGIAIIGMAMRFPDGVDRPQALWDYLMHKKSAMGAFPGSRWNQTAHSGHSAANMIPQKGAHFMTGDMAAFDGPFFSISPHEISSMDPQQRVSLECSYQALENAGLSLPAVAGANISVYVGASAHEYELMLARDPDIAEKYQATGNNMGLLANRVSWAYDLRGPSMVIDTACSSTLNAVHLACQSIRSGETSMSLVGGANIILQVDSMMALHSLGMLSHNSISRSFDEKADGFARGEGCGFVVLKRLSDAVRDGNTIRAVIRASCANQDGHTSSIVQPSSDAQKDLIRLAYKNLDMRKTRYFESHGTGTRLGDSLEANAISSVFNPTPECPLFVGAVKTNFGHLEAASGVLSLIKTVLVLEHGIIPPNAFFNKPNPEIVAGGANLHFPKVATPWPNEGLRRASINSFGFGGANVHLVLDDALHHLESLNLEGLHNTLPLSVVGPCINGSSHAGYTNGETNGTVIGPQLLVWSAADKDGIDRYQTKLKASHTYHTLSHAGEYAIADLAYTLSEKRNHFLWRGFTVANNIKELVENDKIAAIKAKSKPNLAFIFTGQGANWATMGKELRCFPKFASSLSQAQIHFRRLGASWLLEEELERPKASSQLHLPEYSQPICTAIQVALVNLLRDWNVLPHVVVGHSSGEIAAAYCTGAISQESALTIAYYRGAIVKSLSTSRKHTGGMMAVGLSEDEVNDYIKRLLASNGKNGHHKLSVACVNSYNSVTVSGPVDYLDALQLDLNKDAVFCRRLNINVAYHSEAMYDVRQLYHQAINSLEKGILYGEPPTMISTVTGTPVSHLQLQSADYWVENLVSPVLFKQAIEHLQLGSKNISRFGQKDDSRVMHHIDLLIEVGPHSALKGPIRNVLASRFPEAEFSYTSLLIRESCGLQTILTAAGTMFQKGVEIDVHRVNSRNNSAQKQRRMIIDLHPYVFNHTQKYWAEGRLSKNYRFRQFSPHELLGHQVIDWNSAAARWQNFISLKSHPWVEHHKIVGAYVYPGAGILAMAMEGSRQLNFEKPLRGFRFKDVSIVKALVIPENTTVETQLSMEQLPEQNDPLSIWYKFKLFLHEDSAFTQLAHGTIGAHLHDQVPDGRYPSDNVTSTEQNALQLKVARDCWKHVSKKRFYDVCIDHGLEYGDSFRGLDNVFLDTQNCAKATLDLDHWKKSIDGSKYQSHVIHPAILDAVIQLPLAALNQTRDSFPVCIPTQFKDVWISTAILDSSNDINGHRRDRKVDLFCQASYTGFRNNRMEMVATDPTTGEIVLKCYGICTAVDNGRMGSVSANQTRALCYSQEWRPDIDIASSMDIQKYCDVNAAPKVIESIEATTKPLALAYFSAQRTLRQIDSLTLNKQNLRHVEFLKQCLREIESELKPEQQIELSRANDSEEFFLDLCSTIETLSPEGRYVARIARNMQSLLQGRVDAIDLLFSDNLMSEYYQYCIDTDIGFGKLRKWIDAYAHKYPSSKFLEIGAGTGASTHHILEFLKGPSTQRFEEYMFTDISAGFFDKARDSLAMYKDAVQFATLDIENDPAAQGFKTHYDIITATNVLHATKNIGATLRNVRSLLKPGGKLVLTEFINASALFPGYLVGFFSGWWLAQESERLMSPLLSETQWNTVLLEAGFSGIDISFHGYRGERHTTSTMISTLREPNVPKSICGIDGKFIHIIIAPESKLQAEVAEQLQSKLGSSCRIEKLDNLSSALDAEQSIFLPSLEKDVLQMATPSSFSILIDLLSRSRNLLWVYNSQLQTDSGPVNEAIAGFARSAMTEQPDNKIKLLGLNRSIESLHDSVKDVAEMVLRVIMQATSTTYNDHQMSYIEKDGVLYTNRLQTLSELDTFIFDRTCARPAQAVRLGSQSLKMGIATPGSLDTLQFVANDSVQEEQLEDDEIEIAVKACGINFKDVLLALGKIQGYEFGLECAGVVAAAGPRSSLKVGTRVSCFVKGSMATHIRCKSVNAIEIPSWMTFNQGASWTTSFATAYCALVLKAQISQAERVLIHSGAGALGQACIQIAKMYGAEIFTTVGNNNKSEFLTKHYGIAPDHIFSSRNSKFEQEIMAATGDRGVDIIVNSLSGELLQASWRCIGSFGRFLETGKRDMWAGNNLPLSVFEKSVAFYAVDTSQLSEEKPQLLNEIMAKLLPYFESGLLHTLEMTVYPLSKVEQGLRELSFGNTIGKMVLEVQEDDTVLVVPPMHLAWNFPANASYVIVGGLGGIGRSLARWMSQRGATHLILLGRRGAVDKEAQDLITELKQKGTTVEAISCNVSEIADLKKALAKVDSFPPIKGCIQAAMVLEDVSLKSMSLDAYKKVVDPKIKGTWNLHQLLPSGMDFFIMLSSISGVVGGHGQANYASANSYLDGLAEYRHARGENAVSLDLGKILQVGYVAEREDMVNHFMMDMFPGISETELHTLFEFYCKPSPPSEHTASRSQKKSQVIVGIDSPDMLRARGIKQTPMYMEQAIFRQLNQVKSHSGIVEEGGNESTDTAVLLAKASTLDTAIELIVQGFASKLERYLGLTAQDFDDSNALQKYGIDSLSAVELRTWLRNSVGADIPVFDLLSDKSVAQLSIQAALISSIVPEALKPVTLQTNAVAI